MPRFLSVIVLLSVSLLTPSCVEETGADKEIAKDIFSVEKVVPPKITGTSENLAFRYLSRETGAMEVATRVEDVPEEVREAVIVMALNPEEIPHPRALFVANLTALGPDGTYPVKVLDRFDYDGSRQTASAAEVKQKSLSPVVMYSAEWCGVCKKAAQWMRAQNISFVERDVEKDPKALGDLKDAARRAGMTAQSIGGSVPVFSIGNEVFKGFDPNRIRAAADRKK